MTDYWKECISEACDDAGLEATEKQIDTLASWVEGAHENYGMAHGREAIPNPLCEEHDRLKRDLQAEREKVQCGECGGSGNDVSHGPSFTAISQCCKCHGEGRHGP